MRVVIFGADLVHVEAWSQPYEDQALGGVRIGTGMGPHLEISVLTNEVDALERLRDALDEAIEALGGADV